MYTYIKYMYIYMSVCVCVCVYVIGWLEQTPCSLPSTSSVIGHLSFLTITQGLPNRQPDIPIQWSHPPALTGREDGVHRYNQTFPEGYWGRSFLFHLWKPPDKIPSFWWQNHCIAEIQAALWCCDLWQEIHIWSSGTGFLKLLEFP